MSFLLGLPIFRGGWVHHVGFFIKQWHWIAPPWHPNHGIIGGWMIPHFLEVAVGSFFRGTSKKSHPTNQHHQHHSVVIFQGTIGSSRAAVGQTTWTALNLRKLLIPPRFTFDGGRERMNLYEFVSYGNCNQTINLRSQWGATFPITSYYYISSQKVHFVQILPIGRFGNHGENWIILKIGWLLVVEPTPLKQY